jgi:hypothetical protein
MPDWTAGFDEIGRFFYSLNVKLRGTPMMKPEQRSNADDTREPKNASPRRVPLNAMLGRGGAVNIGMKRTLHVAPPLFLKPWIGLLYSNRLPLNSARERASPSVTKKTSATGGTARKELTLMERTFSVAKLTCARKK